MIQFDTAYKRIWLVLGVIWFLFCLAIAGGFSTDVFRSRRIIDTSLVFLVLASAPILPGIAAWIYNSRMTNWVVWGIGMVVWLVLLFAVFGSSGVDEIYILSAIAWGGIMNASFLAAFKFRPSPAGDDRLNNITLSKNVALRQILLIIFGLSTGLGALFAGALVGVMTNLEGAIQSGGGSNAPIGMLTSLTIWSVIWYSWRNGKAQFYRWRNFIFVICGANWLGLATSLFVDPLLGLLTAPVALVLGLIWYVIPRPAELQPPLSPPTS
ncbi:MAG: hypothetical protein COB65_04780 [Thalassobium sp.]|nr:MAG: hypothetical protein COB65_04780 [Thalassobium sp.]